MSYLETVSAGWSTVYSDRRERSLRDDFHQVALPLLDRVHKAAYYLTRDSTEAEDLVQETYLRAFSSFNQFQPGSNCGAWLLSIMRNLFINRYRQRQRAPESIDWEKVERGYETTIAGEERSDRQDPETLVFSKLTGDEINKALQELPEEFRTAIILVDVEELRYEEAARVMNCPVGTVRSRLFRGRRLLQIALSDYALECGLIKKSTAEGSVKPMTSETF